MTHTGYHHCPACNRRKAVPCDLFFGEHTLRIRGFRCSMCHAESTGGQVVRSREDPKAWARSDESRAAVVAALQQSRVENEQAMHRASEDNEHIDREIASIQVKPAQTPLGMRAIRIACKRGWVDYNLAGCTELLTARANGWIKRYGRYKPARYKPTPEGRKVLQPDHAEAPENLTPAQTRYLAEIRERGEVRYNGRARKPLEALERAGLITCDHTFREVGPYGGRYVEVFTARPVDQD